VLVEEQGQTCMADDDADSDEARVLRPLQAASCKYRIAFGPRAGQKVLTVPGAMPAPANERVQTNAAGQVVLKPKTLWRDGTTHLVMSPLEFMQRISAVGLSPRSQGLWRRLDARAENSSAGRSLERGTQGLECSHEAPASRLHRHRRQQAGAGGSECWTIRTALIWPAASHRW